MALRPSRPNNPAEQLTTRGSGRDAAQQDVFLREVDDALREDQLLTAARRYGRLLAAILVVGLAGFGAYLWWDSRHAGDVARSGEKFVVALDRIEGGQMAQGQAALVPLARSGSPGYQAASRLMQAGLAVEEGRLGEAEKLLGAVAADEAAPAPFRELARIREVALRFDGMPPAEVVRRLKPLAVPGNPWFGSAGELVGAAYLKQGRDDLAGPLFAAMAKDNNVPRSLSSRAQQLAGILGVDAVVDAEQAAGSPAPPPQP